MRALKITNLRWLVGILSVLVGAMMLVTPHQFSSPLYAAITPTLPLWGVGFLLVGTLLVGLAVFKPRREVVLVVHLLSGLGWLVLAYGLAVVG
ncbi:MAG: hypothetical protein ACYC1C_01795, partial [Chloroflexota bacterium]